jgi:hypothetical protein
MGKLGKCLLLLTLLLAPLGRGLSAQTATVTPSADYNAHEFPLWARDLRRAEIVAFGSLPFTVLFGTLAVETVTYINHNGDSRYLPWPLKPAGGIAMSRDDSFLALGVAAASSVLISLADFLIVQHKRQRALRAARDLPDGSPIITRRPWPEPAEEAREGAPEPEAPPEETPPASAEEAP